MRARRFPFSARTILLLGFATLAGCGSSSDGPVDGPVSGLADAGPVGGPVSGLADAHCAGVTPIVVNEASCHPAAGTATDPGTAAEEAPVLYNAAGDDDDCKYHVSFTSTSVRLNEA